MTERPRQRLDKWLWCARIVKTRPLAQGLIEAGHVRLNRNKVLKPAHDVGPGDVLTIVTGARVLVFEVVALAERRGPATAARLLYRGAAAPPTSPAAMPNPDGAAAQKRDATGNGTC